MNNSLKKLIYLGATLGLLFVGINQLFIKAGTLDTISSSILYPFLVLQKKIVAPIKAFASNFTFSGDLKDLVNFYKQENDNLQSQLIEFYAIKTYAQSINELNQFIQRYNLKNSIIAQVLLKNFDSDQHFILIDAGSNKNVQEDMVVVYKNCLIGKICKVYKYYSRVILITDKSCKVAAYCISNNIHGIHVGQNDLMKSKLTFVNHLDTVTKGDLVLSSGEGIVFPRGFGLGYIHDAHKEDFNYNIDIKPMIDFTNLDYCCVIQKGAELSDFKAQPISIATPVPEKNSVPEETSVLEIQIKDQDTPLPDIKNNPEAQQSTEEPAVTQEKKIVRKKKILRKKLVTVK